MTKILLKLNARHIGQLAFVVSMVLPLTSFAVQPDEDLSLMPDQKAYRHKNFKQLELDDTMRLQKYKPELVTAAVDKYLKEIGVPDVATYLQLTELEQSFKPTEQEQILLGRRANLRAGAIGQFVIMRRDPTKNQLLPIPDAELEQARAAFDLALIFNQDNVIPKETADAVRSPEVERMLERLEEFRRHHSKSLDLDLDAKPRTGAELKADTTFDKYPTYKVIPFEKTIYKGQPPAKSFQKSR